MKENNNQAENNQKILQALRSTKELYAIMSVCTRMPYVCCDSDTYDDEVFVYFQLADAQNEGKRLVEEKIPVHIVKIENKQLLSFYMTLYTMGVNCIVVNHGIQDEIRIQLDELIKKPDSENMPKGAVWVENRELHLTALYMMQEMRRQQEPQITDEMKENQEEMLAHYSRGSYIMAVKDKKEFPILKMKNGDMMQPLFTDVLEFNKFNSKKQFGMFVVKAEKVPEILAKEAKGVVINPFGVNLPLSVKRQKQQ